MFIHGDNLSIKGDLILGMGDRLDEDLKSSNADHDIHLGDNVIGKLRGLLHEDSIGGDGSAVRGDQSPAVVHFIGIGDIVKGPDGSGGGSTVTNDIVGNHGMRQGRNMRVSQFSDRERSMSHLKVGLIIPSPDSIVDSLKEVSLLGGLDDHVKGVLFRMEYLINKDDMGEISRI